MIDFSIPYLFFGADTLAGLAGFCSQNQFEAIHLIADQNTFPILGQAVESCLQSPGRSVRTTILEGDPLQAGGDAVLQLITHIEPLSQVFIAVGSGTVTDVVRFTSRALARPFISVPTAPSVDAYTSPTSPLIVSGIKQSFPGQLPLAVFAHLPTLCAAPQAMIMAGFGDMLGKLTALADWELGRLLWDEPYDAQIAFQSRLNLQHCIDQVDAISTHKPEGIRILMESLLDSGLNMAKAGSSRPASGAEHHLAHFWEMNLLWDNRPPVLHGIKVGFATLLVADSYSRLRSIAPSKVAAWLKRTSLPDSKTQLDEIRQNYYRNPDRIVVEQKRFLEITPSGWQQLQQRISDQWHVIQSVAALVPTRSEIERILEPIHFPLTAADVGLTEKDVNSGLLSAHYLRDRFTVFKLLFYLR